MALKFNLTVILKIYIIICKNLSDSILMDWDVSGTGTGFQLK